jgi:hypothetical protein
MQEVFDFNVDNDMKQNKYAGERKKEENILYVQEEFCMNKQSKYYKNKTV